VALGRKVAAGSPDRRLWRFPLLSYICVVRSRYLGISSGWMDKDWEWYPEYDQYYGKPLGRAVETTNPPGWK
jgi:hypothetical protein